MHYLYLGIAIVTEVVATATLKATHNFTRLWPSLIVVAGYLCSFYFLTLTIRYIPIGITYAIWSGLGIVLVSLAAYFIYQQKLDLPSIIGITFIIAGVVIINLFSETVR